MGFNSGFRGLKSIQTLHSKENHITVRLLWAAMQIIQLVSGGNSHISSDQLGPQRPCLLPEPAHLQPMDITCTICPDYSRCWTCCPLFHMHHRYLLTKLRYMNGFFTVNYKHLFFDTSFQSWSCVCKQFDLQTVLHTQMSHGLRSKECAGYTQSLLIMPSADTPVRASMNALAIQTVMEYCWNNVQQQFFISQQLGKLVKYLMHVRFRTVSSSKSAWLFYLFSYQTTQQFWNDAMKLHVFVCVKSSTWYSVDLPPSANEKKFCQERKSWGERSSY